MDKNTSKAVKSIAKTWRERAKKAFHLRSYQRPLWDAMMGGCKRAFALWHRGAGKDITCLNLVIELIKRKPGNYYCAFPTYAQGNKVLWLGTDKNGRRYIDYFPKHLTKRIVQDEMLVEFQNGSIFQVVGTDQLDRLRGTGIDGLIFSEYAWHSPNVWNVLEPAVRKKEGWVIFQTTPYGKNHAKRLYEVAQKEPDWFSQRLTVDDTFRDVEGEDGRRLVTDEEIDKLRSEGKEEDWVQREYYCSFEGAVEGTYYFKQIQRAEQEGRITRVPWESALPVYTTWDLGMHDAMSIWHIQLFRNEIRLIDYLEGQGEQLSYYVKMLREKPYVYEEHYLPHDIKVRELGAGSRYDTLVSLGVRPIRIMPKSAPEERIEAVRGQFSRYWIDEDRCGRGLDALREYHKAKDPRTGEYKDRPAKSWANHACDSLGIFALGGDEPGLVQIERPEYYESNFSAF